MKNGNRAYMLYSFLSFRTFYTPYYEKEMVKMSIIIVRLVNLAYQSFIIGLTSIAFMIGNKILINVVKKIFGKPVTKIDVLDLIDIKFVKEKGKLI